MTMHQRFARTLCVLGAVGAALLTSACAPLVVGGAMVGSALVATDRRTSGIQLEDQGIQLKAAARVREVMGSTAHVNISSYNRVVLITGEVPTEADRSAVEKAVARVENVRNIVNEVAVLGNASLTSRSNDVLILSKVKASMIDAKDVMSNAFDVHVERGVVYLMGRVTEREAQRVTDIARGVSGVQKVVRVLEVISEAELAELLPKPSQPPAEAGKPKD
jgi:osmotically-inducible protein OsmY